jgi:hypothetical protein
MPLISAGFAKFIADETDKWAKVIKSAGTRCSEPRLHIQTRFVP